VNNIKASTRKFVEEFKEKILWNTIADERMNTLLKQAAWRIKSDFPLYEIDELFSIGKIKVIQEYNKFNPCHKGGKNSFSAWAKITAKRAMYDKLREDVKQRNTLKKYADENYTKVKRKQYEGNDDSLTNDEISRIEASEAKEEWQQITDIEIKLDMEYKVQEALQNLEGKEKQYIELRFGLGEDGQEYTKEAIINITGLTRYRVDEIEKEIFKELAEELKECEKPFTKGVDGNRKGGYKIQHRAKRR
jgi:RNA polymerase sigma factor (sigma-70 family)